MSEAKGPYCKRVGSSEIQFRGKLEKFVYERTSPYVIDKQVEMINRAHEDGVKEGRASRDRLRDAAEAVMIAMDIKKHRAPRGFFDMANPALECLAKALEADGECVK